MAIVRLLLPVGLVALLAYAAYDALEHGIVNMHVVFARKNIVRIGHAGGAVARWMGMSPSPSPELRAVRRLLWWTARRTPYGCAHNGSFSVTDLAQLRSRHLQRFVLETYPRWLSHELDDGSIWLYGNTTDTDAAIVYFHGGGGVYGSPRDFAGLCWVLSSRVGVPVLALRYPLAPEHPAPAAGLWAASYIVHGTQRYKRLALVSTGGGSYPLTQALTVLRDIESPLFARIRGAALSSPQLLENVRNASLSGPPPMDVHTPLMIACTSAANYADPNATVLRNSLVGMPPMLFQYSAGELLASHAEEGCRRAGKSCELHRIEHGTHAALSYHDFYPEAAEALARVETFLRRVLPVNDSAPQQ